MSSSSGVAGHNTSLTSDIINLVGMEQAEVSESTEEGDDGKNEIVILNFEDEVNAAHDDDDDHQEQKPTLPTNEDAQLANSHNEQKTDQVSDVDILETSEPAEQVSYDNEEIRRIEKNLDDMLKYFSSQQSKENKTLAGGRVGNISKQQSEGKTKAEISSLDKELVEQFSTIDSDVIDNEQLGEDMHITEGEEEDKVSQNYSIPEIMNPTEQVVGNNVHQSNANIIHEGIEDEIILDDNEEFNELVEHFWIIDGNIREMHQEEDTDLAELLNIDVAEDYQNEGEINNKVEIMDVDNQVEIMDIDNQGIDVDNQAEGIDMHNQVMEVDYQAEEMDVEYQAQQNNVDNRTEGMDIDYRAQQNNIDNRAEAMDIDYWAELMNVDNHAELMNVNNHAGIMNVVNNALVTNVNNLAEGNHIQMNRVQLLYERQHEDFFYCLRYIESITIITLLRGVLFIRTLINSTEHYGIQDNRIRSTSIALAQEQNEHRNSIVEEFNENDVFATNEANQNQYIECDPFVENPAIPGNEIGQDFESDDSIPVLENQENNEDDAVIPYNRVEQGFESDDSIPVPENQENNEDDADFPDNQVKQDFESYDCIPVSKNQENKEYDAVIPDNEDGQGFETDNGIPVPENQENNEYDAVIPDNQVAQGFEIDNGIPVPENQENKEYDAVIPDNQVAQGFETDNGIPVPENQENNEYDAVIPDRQVGQGFESDDGIPLIENQENNEYDAGAVFSRNQDDGNVENRNQVDKIPENQQIENLSDESIDVLGEQEEFDDSDVIISSSDDSGVCDEKLINLDSTLYESIEISDSKFLTANEETDEVTDNGSEIDIPVNQEVKENLNYSNDSDRSHSDEIELQNTLTASRCNDIRGAVEEQEVSSSDSTLVLELDNTLNEQEQEAERNVYEEQRNDNLEDSQCDLDPNLVSGDNIFARCYHQPIDILNMNVSDSYEQDVTDDNQRLHNQEKQQVLNKVFKSKVPKRKLALRNMALLKAKAERRARKYLRGVKLKKSVSRRRVINPLNHCSTNRNNSPDPNNDADDDADDESSIYEMKHNLQTNCNRTDTTDLHSTSTSDSDLSCTEAICTIEQPSQGASDGEHSTTSTVDRVAISYVFPQISTTRDVTVSGALTIHQNMSKEGQSGNLIQRTSANEHSQSLKLVNTTNPEEQEPSQKPYKMCVENSEYERLTEVCKELDKHTQTDSYQNYLETVLNYVEVQPTWHQLSARFNSVLTTAPQEMDGSNEQEACNEDSGLNEEQVE